MNIQTAKISAIIITKNEQNCIQRCIESILWVDEIVIVDSGSTDATLNIIQNIQQTQFANIRIYTHTNWQGFGNQKNIALNYAKNNWTLSIDADEIITTELADEIMLVLNQHNNVNNTYMYKIHRLNYFLEQRINYSGWQNDKVVRIFHKEYAQFSNDKVHESVQPKKLEYNKVVDFNFKIHHYSYVSFSQVLQKIEHYSSLGATQLYEQKKYNHISIVKPIVHGLTAFIKSYVLKKGFLDGFCGLNIAIMNGLSSYYKYAKLKYMLKDKGN